jgi:hypothetical protein
MDLAAGKPRGLPGEIKAPERIGGGLAYPH